jgi:16S rRNA (uracil1498-N3)-methyltransferase
MWYSINMRLHRFYMPERITEESFDVTDRDQIHQWKHVFRYNVGSQIILFDGSGYEYLTIIASMRSLGVTLTIMRKKKVEGSISRKLWICLSVIKKDNFEWAVQKATEIGVTGIIPITSDHSEKKKLNMERLRKVAIEASEQSGRGDVPAIEPVTTLSELFARGTLPQSKIACHPNGELIHDFLSRTDPLSLSSVTVFIGPEGGWSEKEVDFFKFHNIPLVSLGTQILRAETATMAVASLLLL